MSCIGLIQNEDFKMIGKLTATSIVQGGPGLPIFLPAVYHYLCFGKYSTELKTAEVPDLLIRNLLEQVRSSGPYFGEGRGVATYQYSFLYFV